MIVHALGGGEDGVAWCDGMHIAAGVADDLSNGVHGLLLSAGVMPLPCGIVAEMVARWKENPADWAGLGRFLAH